MEKARVTAVLRSIGLNKNEVKIFLDLVKQVSSSALEISKRVEIHRSNVYDSLRVLMEKGFVNERIENNKKVFQVVDPEKLRDYILQRGREIESIIPDLQKISTSRGGLEDVSISHGVFAFRSALKGLLDFEKPISVFGIPKGTGDLLGVGFLKNFHDERVNKGIFMRHIYNREAYDRISALKDMRLAEFKHLAKKYDSNVTTMICGNRVVIVVFGDNLSVIIIIISSEDVAESYSNYFDILWVHAKSD